MSSSHESFIQLGNHFLCASRAITLYHSKLYHVIACLWFPFCLWITGGVDAVNKAIKSVSDQIVENASEDQDLLASDPAGPALDSQNHVVPRPESNANRSLPLRGASFGGGGLRDNSNAPPFSHKLQENLMPSRMDVPEMITFRLLCPAEKLGGVIGKGGAIIKTLQHESRCEIKVLEGTSDGEERTIIVSGPGHPDDRISPVQDAVLHIQHRIAKAMPDSKEKGVTAKLIVPSNQIGCLLGKGGSIIAEMRKVTGAYIRIIEKTQIPRYTLDDEVVQVNGELEVVLEAVLQITSRLLHRFFCDAFPSIDRPPNSAFPDRMAPFPSLMGRRELSPPGLFPHFGPPLRNFDSVGAPSLHGGLHSHDDHPAFMLDVNRQGITETPWRHQTSMEGGPMGSLDYGGPQQRRMSGFGGGSQQTIITNTTVEVVVPTSVIPSIYGDDGGCLGRIRQVSIANIQEA